MLNFRIMSKTGDPVMEYHHENLRLKNEFERRIYRALDIAGNAGGIDGEQHKMWTIDQMVRALTGCEPVVLPAGNGEETIEMGESPEYHKFVRDFDESPGDEGWPTGTKSAECELWP